jgi:hypothetical protein
MIAASAALSTSVTKSLWRLVVILQVLEIERRAVDDLAGAARGLDHDVQSWMHVSLKDPTGGLMLVARFVSGTPILI